jgi:1-aminocyclopropane-1-carboxylate deaminase/D-cysteine desulfhydrase-like pyridoxal-dependent ACC family enzyme
VGALWQLPFKALARAAALRAQRRRPHLIPVGGSTPLGARGYIDAVGELASQHVGRLDAAVCALGSGGTLAGLIAGAHVHGRREVLWGVRVTPGVVSSRTLVAALASRAYLGAPQVRAREVRVIDDQLGEGYGITTNAARDAMERFARDGVMLDPTYTAKAAAGLLALAPTLPRGARVLFWNTLSCAPLDALDDGSPLAPSLATLLVH